MQWCHHKICIFVKDSCIRLDYVLFPTDDDVYDYVDFVVGFLEDFTQIIKE